MNSELAFIFARRSVRRYQGGEIGDKQVEDMLAAAMSAPSAVGKDPWRFIVLRDRGKLAAVAEVLPNGKMLAAAPLGIIVCGDIEAAHGGELSFLLQDCSAAIENLLLAAVALELGACWLGVHPRQDRIEHISKIFSLPPNVIPVAAIAIGHPDEFPEPRCRYDRGKVHWEKYQQ